MTEEEDDRFAGALRGESADPALGRRLGELLRDKQKRASEADDEITRRRVWQQIASHIGNESARVGWSRRAALAQAAVFAIVGIALGYFLGSPSPPTATESQLEFAFGDLEVPRGSVDETSIAVADPLEALRPLTEALIADRIAFEIYSVGGGADRRVLFTLPRSIPLATGAALHTLNIAAEPGSSKAITFAKRGASSD